MINFYIYNNFIEKELNKMTSESAPAESSPKNSGVSTVDDDENPEINLDDFVEQKKWGIFQSVNPSTPTTILAMLFNLGWAHSFTYGLTGRFLISSYI
jgi:hypothetical protein